MSQKPRDKKMQGGKVRSQKKKNQPFPESPGKIFAAGFSGYRKNLIPLTGAGLVTISVFAAFGIYARTFDSVSFEAFAINLVGTFLAAVVAYPWYSYALDAADGVSVRVGRPFEEPKRFIAQAAGSFWFWAAVLFGVKYGLGIPSILVLILYPFYGYVIADRVHNSGLKALGTSVRVTEGNRIVLFAFAALFALFNVFGAFAVGVEQLSNEAKIPLAVLGLAITTNITLVAGARIYRILTKDMQL